MAQNLKKSIAKVGYALVTEENGTYTYGTPKWLISDEAGGREYSAEPNGENTEIYSDGIIVYSAEENNGYDITLTLLAVIDDVEKDWDNVETVTNGGILEVAKTKSKPKFALFIIEDTTNEKGQTTIFFNCCISKRPTISGKTSEGSFEAQFPEWSISARPRPADKWVRVTLPQKEQFTTMPEITIKNSDKGVIE